MPTPKHPKGHTNDLGEPFRSELLLPAFHEAFGHFINQVAQTESTLSFYLESYAHGLIGGGFGNNHDDLKLDVLRALLGSTSISDLPRSFKTCMKAWTKAGHPYPEEIAREIDALFAQLGEIRDFRNQTVHNVSHPYWLEGATRFRTVNRYRVTETEKSVEMFYRIEDLEAATLDLQTICLRLPFALGMQKRLTKEDTRIPVQLPPWQFRPSALVKKPLVVPSMHMEPPDPPVAWWTRS